jgi:hypothetical protein
VKTAKATLLGDSEYVIVNGWLLTVKDLEP